jgi:hypothetical protein
VSPRLLCALGGLALGCPAKGGDPAPAPPGSASIPPAAPGAVGAYAGGRGSLRSGGTATMAAPKLDGGPGAQPDAEPRPETTP